MACYGGLWGILTGITKSTDHPSTTASTRQATLGTPVSKPEAIRHHET